MRWRSKTDRDAIIYNGKVTIAGIPPHTHDYTLGSRTAERLLAERLCTMPRQPSRALSGHSLPSP
jgi:predicted helicase